MRAPRRWALGMLGLAALWLFGVWPPPVWWRSHWPRETAMMREETVPGLLSHQRPAILPTRLADISPFLKRMVIIGEDSRFRTHHGVDFIELGDALGVDRHPGVWPTMRAAWRERDRLRGASTITQQLAKNLYLSPSRNPLRKLKEAVTAVRLELALPKDRILELYLDAVEWGPDIWGAERASRDYFGVSASDLTEEQAAELVATIPHPRTSNPVFHPARTWTRRDLILARYRGYDVRVPPDTEIDSLAIPAIPDSLLPPAFDSLPSPDAGDSSTDTLQPR